MDHGVVVGEGDRKLLALEELAEVFPVVGLLVEPEAVVELVHLDLVGVVPARLSLWGNVPREDLCEEPAVGQVTLRICDLVGEVE